MCGFIGMASCPGNRGESPAELTTILRHRGPDASAVWQDDQVLLVHNRLSIIDLNDRANQPFTDRSGKLILVYNGEVYNYKELRAQYNLDCRTDSDTEVIVELYALLGPGFVEQLNGIFAFAIYDQNTRQIIFCRDRFGVKPLYYYQSGEDFYFASEIKGVQALADSAHTLNLAAIGAYLENGSLVHNQETFFAGVNQLPAAHMAVYDSIGRKLRVQRYWDVTIGTDFNRGSEESIVEQTFALLKESAKLNLVSDVEVGLSLSSGTDSTLLLKLLQHHHSGKFRAFTFGFEESVYDEVSRVRQNSCMDGVALQPVYLQKNKMLATLKQASRFFETPLGGLGTLSAYNMMREVGASGIKVMLAGEGADELFGGYQYYYAPFFEDIQGDAELLAVEVAAYAKQHNIAMTPFSAAYCAFIEASIGDRILAPDGTCPQHFHLGEAFSGKKPVGFSRKNRHFASKLAERMYQDLTVKKLPKLLHFQDRSSMAHGVETRVPFLDHRLVDFLYNLPPEMKIRHGVNKYLLRKILHDKFDFTEKQSVKHYVATPQREWLKDHVVRDEILDTVKSGQAYRQGIIDYSQFERDYLTYSEDNELGNSFFIWKVINLEYLIAKDW